MAYAEVRQQYGELRGLDQPHLCPAATEFSGWFGAANWRDGAEAKFDCSGLTKIQDLTPVLPRIFLRRPEHEQQKTDTDYEKRGRLGHGFN